MKKEKKHEKTKETISLRKKEYDELTANAAKGEEYYNKWLRVHADFENVKKRLEKEKVEFLKFANEDLILQILPIVDNFDRAINSRGTSDKEDPHLKGLFLIKDDLHKLLETYGVEKVKSVGEKFNPEFHEAVMVVESDDHPEEEMVLEELQAGYTMHGRLIRPASVKVSKKKEDSKDV